MAKKGPLKVNIFIKRKDGVISYESLTEQEKIDFGKRMNQRAIRAAALANGYEVEFTDLPPKAGTA